MTHKHFEELLKRRLGTIRDTLASKATEYALDDRLHNFKKAAELLRTDPPTACLAFFSKHMVSIVDLVNGDREYDRVMLDEKIGDAVNYLILLEALMVESLDEEAFS